MLRQPWQVFKCFDGVDFLGSGLMVDPRRKNVEHPAFRKGRLKLGYDIHDLLEVCIEQITRQRLGKPTRTTTTASFGRTSNAPM